MRPAGASVDSVVSGVSTTIGATGIIAIGGIAGAVLSAFVAMSGSRIILGGAGLIGNTTSAAAGWEATSAV